MFIKYLQFIETAQKGEKYYKVEFSLLTFIYSEKAKKFCEISTLLFFYAVPVKSKVEILQHFVAFSEYIYEL